MLFFPNKSDPQYIRNHIVLYESMVEYIIEKYSVSTYFGNKKIRKIKKNAPTRTIKFLKKDEIMIFFKAPNDSKQYYKNNNLYFVNVFPFCQLSLPNI